ncbi:MAG: hypothetical protein AAF662_04635 [Pseudomonadota bacterium]
MLQADPEILDLIPHREPMLLLHELIMVDSNRSAALVHISNSVPFYENGRGVPAIVGIEFMGQTAALIAGHQRKTGQLANHLGFLLGVRNYTVDIGYFPIDVTLKVTCTETAVVGDGLAKFSCDIERYDSGLRFATGELSVFRQPIE